MTTDTLHYLVVTSPGFSPEIDTIISGHEALRHARAHRKELIRDCDFAPSNVVIIAVPGDQADALEDHIRAGGRIGAKSLSTFNARKI